MRRALCAVGVLALLTGCSSGSNQASGPCATWIRQVDGYKATIQQAGSPTTCTPFVASAACAAEKDLSEVVLSNPQCFSAADMATAQAYKNS
jgi:hypothetical protein